MPEDVERKGLGTPATRAGIIEKLVRVGFLERQGDKKVKYLIPTHKGTALVTVMPEQIGFHDSGLGRKIAFNREKRLYGRGFHVGDYGDGFIFG